MKRLFFIAALFISIVAPTYASPFDGFVGEYNVTGTARIIYENAKWCNRFDFKNMLGLKIEKNTAGFKQSHVLYIQKPNGWSGHPVTEFSYTNEFRTGGSYGKTSGSGSIASNEYGAWGTNLNRKETLTVTIEKSASGYTFSMAEALYENSALKTACYYQVELSGK